jgi:phage tail-like protein
MQKSDRGPDAIPLHGFGVEIDGLDLGLFTGCDGLSAEYTFEEITVGGNNAYLHRLPGRVKYSNIKLTRLLNEGSISKLAAWFSQFQDMRQPRMKGKITLFDGTDRSAAVCHWELAEVHPVKWTGPSFSTDGTGVAKETLEIAHHGFTWKAGA